MEAGTPAAPATAPYRFALETVRAAQASKLPPDATRNSLLITGFNYGCAPVSVSIVIDEEASRNIPGGLPRPINAVVAPGTDQVVRHVIPEKPRNAASLRYTYSWSIGDYRADHACAEGYRIPLRDDVRAFASIEDDPAASAYRKNGVGFLVPVGTPVLAARKGVVVQIKRDQVDLLHEDSTIGSYHHLRETAEGLAVGKAVSTDDVIGIAGALDDNTEAYLLLTVWRPEPRPLATLPSADFAFVSFPLEFCAITSNQCGPLRQDQVVYRNRINFPKKDTAEKTTTGKSAS